MSKNVVVIQSTTYLDYVMEVMVRHRVSRVVVINANSIPLGIISDKDLLWYALTKQSRDPAEVTAHEVMSRPLAKAPEETPLSYCAKWMIDAAISSVVVAHGDELIGIVTKTDLCRFYAKNGGESERVRRRMSASPITTSPSLGILQAARIMAERRISRIPVMDDHLVGIITLSDLTSVNPALRSAANDTRLSSFVLKERVVWSSEAGGVKVGDVMTRNPVTVPEDAYLSDAARSMIDHRISGLPVMSTTRQLVGILTKTDITKAVADLG